MKNMLNKLLIGLVLVASSQANAMNLNPNTFDFSALASYVSQASVTPTISGQLGTAWRALGGASRLALDAAWQNVPAWSTVSETGTELLSEYPKTATALAGAVAAATATGVYGYRARQRALEARRANEEADMFLEEGMKLFADMQDVIESDKASADDFYTELRENRDETEKAALLIKARMEKRAQEEADAELAKRLQEKETSKAKAAELAKNKKLQAERARKAKTTRSRKQIKPVKRRGKI